MGQYRSAVIMASVAVALALASWLLPNQREFAAAFALVCAVGAGSTALFAWPDGVAFIKRRSRLLVVVGWSVSIVGFAAGLGLALIASLRSSTAINLFLYAGMALAFLGFMVARLPSMVTRVAQSRADLAALKSVENSPATFDGLREGLEASLSVVRGGGAFLQIAGPWAAVLTGVVYLILVLGKNVGHSVTSSWLILLGGILLLVAAIYLIIPTVTVAWFRWTIGSQLPSRFFALPDRTALSFAWRIWISLTFMGAVDKFMTPKLTHLAIAEMPQYAAAVGGWAGWAIDVLVIMLFSSFALQLPAVAVGDANFSRTAALVQGRKMWPRLPVGLVISLAPFPIFAWACASIYAWRLPAPNTVHSALATVSPLDAIGFFGVLVVLFATLASGATFLSRAYLAAKARS